MIELDALREQLRLLGHDLPDDQIVTILEEMNIDFSADAAGERQEGRFGRATLRAAFGPDSPGTRSRK
eukprot:365530-Chlamydomonas_euryale.AAC.13